MRTTHIPALADVAADAAAGSIITDYLTARGVRTVPTLAFIAKTEEELGPTPHPTTVCGIHPGDSAI